MLKNLLGSIFGTRNNRLIGNYKKLVTKINALEDEVKKLKDADFKVKTEEFKERIKKGESLESMLIEAFAHVREASVRSLGMRHFDEQLIGGMVLNDNKISEMRTGE
ncbi:MAG: preprotein translocase subunit SecA, partial [Nitrosomonadales bacterium]|nr:preprotein translocase subunit SecA [Nitrosomonadales bacterium]